jgi:WD40 repeat protein
LGYDDAILDITRDGRTLASVERRSWDGYSHSSYSFTPDGRTIVSGGSSGVITAYGLDGKPLGNFVGHESDVWAVTPSPDGRYLVSASHDQTVRLWNLATSRPTNCATSCAGPTSSSAPSCWLMPRKQ